MYQLQSSLCNHAFPLCSAKSSRLDRVCTGFLKKQKEDYDALVTAKDAAIEHNKVANKVVFKPLETSLRNLLETLVAGEPQRRASGGTGRNTGVSVDALSAAATASAAQAKNRAVNLPFKLALNCKDASIQNFLEKFSVVPVVG